MDFNDYQQEVMRTCGVSKADHKEGLVMTSMGVSGEAGEVIEHVKKVVFHGHRLDRTLIEKELGDVMW